MFRDVPGYSGMFRNVPECSGMFHVPGFIDGLQIGKTFQVVSACREKIDIFIRPWFPLWELRIYIPLMFRDYGQFYASYNHLNMQRKEFRTNPVPKGVPNITSAIFGVFSFFFFYRT